jgi:predicted metalloprotease
MRWDDFRRSDNIEDDRGSGGGFSGGGLGFPVGGGGLGIGTVIVLGLIGWATGIDPSILIGGAEMVSRGSSQYQQPYRQPNRRTGTPTDQAGQFVAAVLGNTEDTWGEIFRAGGQQYRPPRLRLFSGSEQGGCGFAQAAMGPFYCPTDRRIYLDTSFFREIETRFRGCEGNACKFSQAYVIAHEVGHHVQNLLGTLPKAQAAQRAAGSKPAANRIQVRVELQADCYAGVWANHSEQRKQFLDPGDIDAALQTASAIGDDTLQRRAQGRVVPDAFTHGSAEQRKRWFTTGFTQGKLAACDTFAAAQL